MVSDNAQRLVREIGRAGNLRHVLNQIAEQIDIVVGVDVLQHGGNPAVMAAIGMFSGYCGTLMTPMAANFNIVPAALLELPDKNAVIKAQVPTGILLLLVNVFLMYFLMFL